MAIDTRIAKFIIRRLDKYVKNRAQKKDSKLYKKWLGNFNSDNKFRFFLEEGLEIYMFKDSILSYRIFKGFEETELIFLKRFLKRGDIFFDLGANIGIFSLNAAKAIGEEGTAHAFEPTPETFSRLEMNVELNRYENIIKCNNIGLSETPGFLKMNISTEGYDAWNTFAASTEEFLNKTISVPVDTLDNYIIRNNIKIKDISLVKVDVEGWEVFVFKGAKEMLKSEDAPPLLVEFTETNAFAAGTSCYELYDFIKSYGYNWYTYDDKNNKLIPEPKRIHYPYNNLLAIKNYNEVFDKLK
jgi:FkbM family methyltransferase